jgi:hypothetical protein
MTRSVHEILESAFNEIKESQGLVVDIAHFKYVETVTAASANAYFLGVTVECKTLPKDSGEE